MPSLTSNGAGRVLEQVAAPRRGDPTVGPHGHPGPVAAGLVEPHDQVAAAVVGRLDGVDLHAVAVHVDDRGRHAPIEAAGSATTADLAHREVEALGLADDVGEARAVRQHADRHPVAALVGQRIGVAGGAGQADPHHAVEHGMPVAAVVEHGDPEAGLGQST